MRKFNLHRIEDETGISGTGIVTEGYEFDNGVVVMRWLTETSSIAVYRNIMDVVKIHGHQGKTVLRWCEGGFGARDIPDWFFDPVDNILNME